MTKSLKKVFKTKEKAYDSDQGKDVEKEVELAIVTPSSQVKQKARIIYARAWREAVEGGAIIREVLDKYLRRLNLWDDEREKEFQELREKILDGTRKIKMGGNAGLTKAAARVLALQIIDWRDQMSDMLMERNRIDTNTADAFAEQQQFNYMVAACTVYNDTNRPYFTSNGFDPDVGVFIDRSEDEIARDASTHFGEVFYDTQGDNLDNLPEKKFLRDCGYADIKGRLIDEKGRLIDRKGRLINDENRFVNDKGELVDAKGNKVDGDGNYIVEFAPFLDEIPPKKSEPTPVIEKKKEEAKPPEKEKSQPESK